MKVLLKHLTHNEIRQPSRHGILVPKRCAEFFPALDSSEANPRVKIQLVDHPNANFAYYNQRTRDEYRLLGVDPTWIHQAKPRDLLVMHQHGDGNPLTAEIIAQESSEWNKLCAFTDGAGGAIIDEAEFSVCRLLVSVDPFVVEIDPGNATADEVADVLTALSDLHRAAGGLGLEFRTDGTSAVLAEVVSV